MLLPVNDPLDDRIDAFRDIRDRDLKGRGGCFMIEGEVVLRAALKLGRFPVEALLIAENRVGPLAGLLEMVPPTVPVYVASRPVLDAVAGFALHRGVLAIGRRTEDLSVEQWIDRRGGNTLVVGLGAIANNDNMGGIFRNCSAFGVDAVLLDDECCDPLYRKSIRVSVGGSLVTPFFRGGTMSDICDRLLAHGFDVLATSPSGQMQLRDIKPGRRCAVLFGAEGGGLPATLLRRLKTVRIDMNGDFDSLNVATTSGIVLHHLVTCFHNGC